MVVIVELVQGMVQIVLPQWRSLVILLVMVLSMSCLCDSIVVAFNLS